MISILWFLIGAVSGSVANAVIYRLPRGISWSQGRSKCDSCGHELSWIDLIPLLSYISLGGICRYCQKQIGIRNFLVELSMAVGFLALSTPHLALILWLTVVIAVMDWETMLVSDWLVGAWLLVVLVTMNHELITMNLIGLAVGVGLIGGLWALTRGRGMGFGDVEIAAVMGLWLGWPNIVVGLQIAFVAGAVVGLIKIAINKGKLKSQIAFGTFLVFGAWIAYIWGDTIIHTIYGF